jgi:isopropylmalate/homocitrate/citramalate synthase
MDASQVAVHITDVGPRDGLQNEQGIIPLASKVELVEALAAAGLTEIEIGSFVRPDVIPQLADSAELFTSITRRPGVLYTALVPNQRGLDRALEVAVDKVAVFTSASEGFARANVNGSIADTIDRFRPVLLGAHAAGCRVRGYVSCVIACPYDGPTDPVQVRAVCDQLLELGVDEIDLGDTIGVAKPADIDRLLDGLGGLLEPGEIVLHLHDTSGTAVDCAERALQLGVRRFDASCGGLGGCPFAPGSPGNLATESLLDLCERAGLETGISRAGVAEASSQICSILGVEPRGTP